METPPGVELCSELHSLFWGNNHKENNRMKKQIVSLLLTGSMVCAPAAMAAQPNQTAGNWYDDAMSVWAQRGVLKGDGSGSLNPTGYITRGELAVILDRIMDYQIAANNSFADVANEAWYTDAVLKACAAGVL